MSLNIILANIFLSVIHIPEAGLLTVTNVKVTNDLKIAKIYISFLENKKPVDEVLSIIKSKNNLIRHCVGMNLTLKYTPQLRYFHDDTLMYAQHIDNLIQKIHKDD